MLNLFKNESDSSKQHQYKTAKLKDAMGNEEEFKYYQLDRTDIRRVEHLPGIWSQEYSMIIRTTSSIEFNIKSKIIIDGRQYAIDNMYTEEQSNSNGMFRNNMPPYKYLALIR